jgi:branched-chain amino acid transport system permease protein
MIDDFKRRALMVSAAVFLLALVPVMLPQYYVGLVARTLIWSILATSVAMMLGQLGLASVGHGVFFGIAAYMVAIVVRHVVADAIMASVVALLTTIFAAAVFGLLTTRTKDIFFLMIMLAICQVFYAIAFSWRSVTGGDDGLPGILTRQILPWVDLEGTRAFYVFVLIIFLMTIGGFWLLINSPFGLALRGIRDSESRMRALGYNVWLYKYLAFIISGLISGIAGILNAFYDLTPNPSNFGLILSSTALLMVILGGPGTLAGPILGALVIVFLQDMVSGFTDRWLMVLGFVYVLVVLAFPEGILGAFNRMMPTRKTLSGK